jgi:hypothetical protein
MYENYAARGDAFAHAVKELLKNDSLRNGRGGNDGHA